MFSQKDERGLTFAGAIVILAVLAVAGVVLLYRSGLFDRAQQDLISVSRERIMEQSILNNQVRSFSHPAQ